MAEGSGKTPKEEATEKEKPEEKKRKEVQEALGIPKEKIRKDVPLEKLKEYKENTLEARTLNRKQMAEILRKKDIPMTPKTLEKILKEEYGSLKELVEKKKEKKKKEESKKIEKSKIEEEKLKKEIEEKIGKEKRKKEEKKRKRKRK